VKIKCLAMKILNGDQMVSIVGGLTARHLGCVSLGLAAGLASGCNPIIGGLTTFACFMLN
jgi:hypothetical protein